MIKLPQLKLSAQLAISAVAGAMIPLTLAPYNIWPLAFISLAALAWLMSEQSGKRCGLLSFVFGLGLYGVGASWVYVSIHHFGSTSFALSLLMTVAFVSGLALCFALPFVAYGRWLSRMPSATVWAFPAVYVLGEWMRTWFLTGFPWLYLGYGHLHSPLSGWAPLFGVLSLSLMVAFTSTTLLATVTKQLRAPQRIAALSLVCSLWVGGIALSFVQWTEIQDDPIEVGIAQANIPQELKWEPSFLNETFRIFHELSDELWEKDWVIWPEAAIPLLFTEAQGDLESLNQQALRTDTVFITGILYDNWDNVDGLNWEDIEYYNSLVALGNGSGVSYKTRLVPFGEYVPLEEWLRGLIAFFDLPTSIIHPGPAYTDGLNANGVRVAPTICYEVVYPDLVAKRARQADILLTVSNDAWFGLSIGPIQHFEMAQMRALETGRYMIRATNNGLTGIIDTKGNTLMQGGRYTRESLSGTVYTVTGQTPFLVWLSYPLLVFCIGMLIWTIIDARRSTAGRPD